MTLLQLVGTSAKRISVGVEQSQHGYRLRCGHRWQQLQPSSSLGPSQLSVACTGGTPMLDTCDRHGTEMLVRPPGNTGEMTGGSVSISCRPCVHTRPQPALHVRSTVSVLPQPGVIWSVYVGMEPGHWLTTG